MTTADRGEIRAHLLKTGHSDPHPDLVELVAIIQEMDEEPSGDLTGICAALGLDEHSALNVALARAHYALQKLQDDTSLRDIVACAHMEGVMAGVRFQLNRQGAS